MEWPGGVDSNQDENPVRTSTLIASSKAPAVVRQCLQPVAQHALFVQGQGAQGPQALAYRFNLHAAVPQPGPGALVKG